MTVIVNNDSIGMRKTARHFYLMLKEIQCFSIGNIGTQDF